jgi:hypothetical protein
MELGERRIRVESDSSSIIRDGWSRIRSSHSQLSGTRNNLQAAELASRALRDPKDRRRFVSQVRSALADDIERGEPLQPVRLRERAKEAKNRRPLSRE